MADATTSAVSSAQASTGTHKNPPQPVNHYIRRLAGTPKSCFVCYRPSPHVLVSKSLPSADFFYVCPSHLADYHFATRIDSQGEAAAAPSSSAALKDKVSKEDIEAVKKEWEQRQKDKEQRKKQQQQGDEGKKDSEGGKDAKKEGQSTISWLSSLVTQPLTGGQSNSSTAPNPPSVASPKSKQTPLTAAPVTTPRAGEHEHYLLHRHFYELRLDIFRKAAEAKRRKEAVLSLPRAPTTSVGQSQSVPAQSVEANPSHMQDIAKQPAEAQQAPSPPASTAPAASHPTVQSSNTQPTSQTYVQPRHAFQSLRAHHTAPQPYDPYAGASIYSPAPPQTADPPPVPPPPPAAAHLPSYLPPPPPPSAAASSQPPQSLSYDPSTSTQPSARPPVTASAHHSIQTQPHVPAVDAASPATGGITPARPPHRESSVTAIPPPIPPLSQPDTSGVSSNVAAIAAAAAGLSLAEPARGGAVGEPGPVAPQMQQQQQQQQGAQTQGTAKGADVGFEASRLGTRAHWDGVYARELNNWQELGEEGEVWFGSQAVDRMVRYVLRLAKRRKVPLVPPRILDLGSGNGHLLLEVVAAYLESLEDEGEDDGGGTNADGHTSAGQDRQCLDARRMLGVDYSEASVSLAQSIGRRRAEAQCASAAATPAAMKNDAALQMDAVQFKRADLCDEGEVEALRTLSSDARFGGPSVDEGWDVVCDKGTFDAIALSPDTLDLARYIRSIERLTRPGGVALVTSCNFTEAELKARLAAPECGFTVEHVIPTPTFSFGGKKGSSTTTIAFRRKA